MISFIVPAHNEAGGLATTLQAIHESARTVEQPYEIIVVDDASTDATPDIARRHGARVVPVQHRQIAATRNSGGRAALGERLFFIDADTTINPRAVAAALKQLDQGAVGGGAPVKVDGPVPLYISMIAWLSVPLAKLAGFTGGAFMFCTRGAFQTTGGFNERVYWSEEGFFAMALKRIGRFAVLWESVLTSGRRFRKVSGLELMASAIRMLISPRKMFTERASVQKIWYDSDRSAEEKMSSSWWVKLSNGFVLLILLDLVTGVVWDFVPWSMTPLDSPIGKARYVNSVFLCHVGIFLWVPVALLLFNLLRQRTWAGSLHSAAFAAFCSWHAWGATRAVIRMWVVFGTSLANFFAG